MYLFFLYFVGYQGIIYLYGYKGYFLQITDQMDMHEYLAAEVSGPFD